MNVFQFIFYIGIIHIIFEILWRFVFIMPMLFIFDLIKINHSYMHYVFRGLRVLGSYFLVSLTGILTLSSLSINPSVMKIVFYPLIGSFILLLAYTSHYHEIIKEIRNSASMELSMSLSRDLDLEGMLMFLVVIFYIFTLIFPSAINNNFNLWLYKSVFLIFDIPVVGGFIGLMGVFYMIKSLSHGFFALYSMAKTVGYGLKL